MLPPKFITVTQLTYAVKRILEDSLPLENIWIQGEISNFTAATSGHYYFTLKDAGARLSCVMFRSQTRGIRFKPGDGMAVAVRGRLSVYEKTGQYQLYAEEMVQTGLGDLYQAFEKLKVKLELEGLFDPGRKKALPGLPQKIALITSPTGAALQDMIKILRRRRPNVDILIFPAQVQGEEAPSSLVKALQDAARFHNLDLAIIGRGGGSLEELWAFNDERVARAIADFPIPIIAAVGHETDFTIADFVADLRAPTPSGAAELAVPDQTALRRNSTILEQRLRQGIARILQRRRQELQRLSQSRVFQRPKMPINQRRQELDLYHEALTRNLKQRITLERGKYGRILGKLDTLSPLATLGRGYAIVQKEDGTFVKNAWQTECDELIKVTLARGILSCRVIEKENDHDRA